MREAIAFLTAVGGARRPVPAALRWFPAVGALLGLALGGLWWAAGRLWAPGVAAALVVAGDLAVTGLLHLDGLVDAADGLLPHMARAERLAVMRRPDAGAFGVGVAGAVLLIRWATLTSLHPTPLLLGALWCSSRSSMAVAAAALPYARDEGGIASAFRAGAVDGDRRRASGTAVAAVPALCGSLALAAWWAFPAGPAAVLGAVTAFGLVVVLAMGRIGGFTGDVLGAAGMVAETAGLLVAAARW